jgi:hypothetical protein
MAVLPPFWRPVLAPLERYGIMLLFLFIFLGGYLGGFQSESVITAIINPVHDLLLDVFAPR